VQQLIESTGYRPRGGYVVGRWTLDGALSFMDRHEIGAQILSLPLAMPAPGGNAGFVARFSRQINEDLAGVIKDHPNRFGAFAALPLNDPDAALTEIGYALDDLGLDGVVVTSNAYGHYFGQPFWEPILDELERRQVPVFVHPTDCPCIDILAFGRPSSVVEFPFDTARNITNALYTGVFQRYPRLRLILAHCGGPLPSLAWRIAEHTEMGRGPTDAEIGPDHVLEVLRGLYYEIALAGSANSLLPTLQVTSADHLLFGTDFPAAPERTIRHNINNFMAFDGLDSAGRTRVEHGNAAALFPRFG
jgi:predicted TIM-barrel fold metal-dependent hydrolase